MTYQSNDNAILIDSCTPLRNLKVQLEVTEDLSTTEGAGFSLQVNAYPPPGRTCQGQTLTWFQYIIYVVNNALAYEIQYWANNSTPWPSGYVPDPAGTTPWLPVLPNDYYLTTFGSAPSNTVPRGSLMEIALTTDQDGSVTSADFTVTDPDANVSTSTFSFPFGARYPISAFEVNLVGPGGGANCTFTTGLTASRGIFYYSVSPGTLAAQSGGAGAACGEFAGWTAETSNAVYSDLSPASGPSLSQTLGQPVDCAVNHLVTTQGGTAGPDLGNRLRRLRDGTVTSAPSGQWLIDTLHRHAAELAGLLGSDPELARESLTLLREAESTAVDGGRFGTELVQAALHLVERGSSSASPSLRLAARPLPALLRSLEGRTLEEGLSAASVTVLPRFPVPS